MKFKETIRNVVKQCTSKTLEQLINKVDPIIRGWNNYFLQCDYPQRVFFKMDWSVVSRFYRWSKRLGQHRSKCLAPGALKVLQKKGLEFFVAPNAGTVKGAL